MKKTESGASRFGKEVSLAAAKHNDVCRVLRVGGNDLSQARLLDLGFTPDTEVRVHNVAPLGKTLLLELRGYTLAIRASAAELVKVVILKNEKPERAKRPAREQRAERKKDSAKRQSGGKQRA